MCLLCIHIGRPCFTLNIVFAVARGTTAVQTYNVKAVRSTTYLFEHCSIQSGPSLAALVT